MQSDPFRFIVSCVRYALGGLVFVGLAINLVNVILRYVFLSPLPWAEELMTYGMVWCVFLGAVLVTIDQRHLSMDIVYTHLPPAFRRAVDVLILLAMVAVCAFVVVQSWFVVSLMFQYGQKSMAGNIPMSIPHASVLVGFALMLLAAIRNFRKPRKATPAADMTPSSLSDNR